MPSYRVFLSSPGDVADERGLARHLLKDELPYDPLLHGRVTFDVVSWDDPDAPMPMLAGLTPQEAVNRFGPEPAACDIVVVVLWSRMGTHLDVTRFTKPNGEPYLSGTEWEFENACNARPQPEILVYRRTEMAKVELGDPDLTEKLRQYELVEQFFKNFKNLDGSFRRGVISYGTPTDFKERLANDLKYLLRERLDRSDTAPAAPAAEPAPVWTGSPYPGLRAFTGEEAPIFFGREREVDALVARLRDPGQRFLAVVGASGTGKSSLVRAGLLPRLRDGAIEGSRHWPVLAFTPGATGDDPFLALAVELARLLPAPARRPPVEIAAALAEAPERVTEHAAAVLAEQPAGAALVLFVDQFEELFAPAAARHRGAFVGLLARAAGDPRLRVLGTLRADFLPACAAEPALAAPFQAGTFVLGPPGPAALVDMIRKPAERAGLELEDGLADEILRDGGGDSGALPLVAFCLEDLYRREGAGRRLTLEAYHALGGLRGAIGRRAAALLEEVRESEGPALDAALPRVFRSLVRVNATGTATRRWAFRDELAQGHPILRLVETLTRGRLLLAEDAGGRAVVMLAHDALIREWPALSEWLDRERAQLQRIQRLLLSLAAPEVEDREHAAAVLGEMGPAAAEAVPVLITALSDAEKRVRVGATEALGRIGPSVAGVVPALIAALGDADEEIRREAAESLGKIGPAAEEAVPALIATLHNTGMWARSAAAGALGRIGPSAAEVVPALIAALGDAGSWVRRSAAESLGKFGPAAADAAPALMAALVDPDRNVAEAADAALERIRSMLPPAPLGRSHDPTCQTGRAPGLQVRSAVTAL